MGFFRGFAPFITRARLSRFAATSVSQWAAAAVSAFVMVHERFRGHSMEILAVGTFALFRSARHLPPTHPSQHHKLPMTLREPVIPCLPRQANEIIHASFWRLRLLSYIHACLYVCIVCWIGLMFDEVLTR